MNEQQNNQPRRSLLRAILPYLLIVLAIGAFVTIVVLKNKSGVDKWSSDPTSLDKAFEENQIITAEVNRKETLVEVSGVYVKEGDNKVQKYSFTVDLDDFTNEFTYQHKVDEILVTENHPSYHSMLKQEIAEYRASGLENADDAKITINDAYQVTWWEQWGPTIISIGVTVLIALFLFSMLSRSVNGSNNKALEFNRSRARKINNSKVRFGDVAGCDEEKAEMEELVQFPQQADHGQPAEDASHLHSRLIEMSRQLAHAASQKWIQMRRKRDDVRRMRIAIQIKHAYAFIIMRNLILPKRLPETTGRQQDEQDQKHLQAG